MDGARHQGWRVSISSSPTGITSSFFSPVAVLPIVCARVLAWLLATVGRSIAWQDDSTLLIDEWVH